MPLLLVDYSVNDAYEGNERVSVSVEVLTRYLLEELPQAALLFVDSYPGNDQTDLNSARSIYQVVAKHYSVPLIVYRSVFYDPQVAWHPGCQKEKNVWRHCGSHPGAPVHTMIGHVVLSSVLHVMSLLAAPHQNPPAVLSLPAPVATAAAMRNYALCRDPLSLFADWQTSGVHVAKGNWSYYEDRPGKPGWIVQEAAGATIDFPLAFGAQPLAVLSYMRGYDLDLGEVRVSMHDVSPQGPAASVPAFVRPCNGPCWKTSFFQVDALRDDDARVTQSASVTIDAGSTAMVNYAFSNDRVDNGRREGRGHKTYAGLLGFGVPQNARGTLRVRLLCPRTPVCRFKILAVMSC
tara:strand:- start:2925 stop:3971 length:1047 start_codon:yes stop_codon:yes gene_type:complete